MLHCARCLSLVSEGSQPATSTSVMPSGQTLQTLQTLQSMQTMQSMQSMQYPLYQNCNHTVPGRCEEEELSLLAELSSLRVAVLQNQLEQARLQEKLLKTARVPPIFTEEVLKRSRVELLLSGWYYGALSWQESAILLQNTRDGTFLVRESQDPKFLYSLSLQRSKEGPTSVRISFFEGKFSLDADPAIRGLMPKFESIGSLISHYSEERSRSPAPNILIRRPLYKQPPTLAHSARLIINKSLKQQSRANCSRSDQLRELQLPPKLVEYLRSYTLSI